MYAMLKVGYNEKKIHNLMSENVRQKDIYLYVFKKKFQTIK